MNYQTLIPDLKNNIHYLDKIFTCEALHHYKASGKNSSSESCCYGNHNLFIAILQRTIAQWGGGVEI